MPEREYDVMRHVEDTYWWYRVLHNTVAKDLEEIARVQHSAIRVLDAGCGTGGTMETLRKRAPGWDLQGVDFAAPAVKYCQERGLSQVKQGSVDDLPYEDASFDALISLDVLYFTGLDQKKSVREFHRVLKPGGTVILNLPAFDQLRGSHDAAVRGGSRFTPDEVERLLEDAGFHITRCHCWNLWLFFPIFIWRSLSRVGLGESSEAKSDLSMLPTPLNALLKGIGYLDMTACRASRPRVGTSVYAVATKL